MGTLPGRKNLGKERKAASLWKIGGWTKRRNERTGVFLRENPKRTQSNGAQPRLRKSFTSDHTSRGPFVRFRDARQLQKLKGSIWGESVQKGEEKALSFRGERGKKEIPQDGTKSTQGSTSL